MAKQSSRLDPSPPRLECDSCCCETRPLLYFWDGFIIFINKNIRLSLVSTPCHVIPCHPLGPIPRVPPGLPTDDPTVPSPCSLSPPHSPRRPRSWSYSWRVLIQDDPSCKPGDGSDWNSQAGVFNGIYMNFIGFNGILWWYYGTKKNNHNWKWMCLKMGYTMGFFSYASNSTMNFHGKMTKSTIRFRGNYPIFRQTQMSTVILKQMDGNDGNSTNWNCHKTHWWFWGRESRISSNIKQTHVWDFANGNPNSRLVHHGFFGSESVGPMSASSSPLVTNGNSPRWKGTKNASEVNWPKARIEIWSVLKDLRSQNVWTNIKQHKPT